MPLSSPISWRRSASLAVGGALAWAALLQGQSAPSPSAEIEAYMASFFEAWTARSLTGIERRGVVREMLTFYDGDAEAAAAAATTFEPYTRILRNSNNPAAVQSTRKELLTANHFHERVGSISRRLIYEPDPPRVSDATALRVLANSDLDALVRLRDFVRSGVPRDLPVADSAREALARALQSHYQEGRELPQLYAEASILWIGLTTHWPRWTPRERQMARRYVDRGFEIDLTPILYEQLLGLTPISATSRQRDDLRSQTRSMLGAIPSMEESNRVLDRAIAAARR